MEWVNCEKKTRRHTHTHIHRHSHPSPPHTHTEWQKIKLYKENAGWKTKKIYSTGEKILDIIDRGFPIASLGRANMDGFFLAKRGMVKHILFVEI